MPIKVERGYIDECLKRLYSLLGIHETLSEEEVYNWINKGNVNEANKIITTHIGISNPVYVEFTKGEEIISSSLTLKEAPSFIVAQIEIPQGLPVYGDPSLKDFPVRIKLSNELKYKSRKVIGYVLAHENTHLILNLLYYQQKNREVDTDLASIVLGLGNLIKKGRFQVNIESNIFYTKYRTETFGYLDYESFEYAYKKVTRDYKIYREWKLKMLKKIESAKALLFKNRKIYSLFKNNHDWILKHLNSLKIGNKDSQRFVQMEHFVFQYPDFNDFLTKKENIFEEICRKLLDKKIYWPDEDYNFILNYNTLLETNSKIIRDNYNSLREWLKTQIKYVKFSTKVLSIITLIKN
jgi:predicted metal-dependent hydrolase